MKQSYFNILSDNNNNHTKFLLYNTLHDHRILFDDPALNPKILIDKALKHRPLTSKEAEAVTALHEMGVLLDDQVDERAIFEEWYESKIKERTDLMQVTLLPTMGCNLACDYCFEKGVQDNRLMTTATAEKVVHWIQRRMERVQTRELHLTHFGGEPLLNPQVVQGITKSLWDFCQERGISMETGMITNAVLLTPQFVDSLLPCGFKWIKVTFDGDRDAHDRKRVWHNGRPTFDTIYKNLSAIHGKLKVLVGGNFDDENYESLYRLVDRLKNGPFADDIAVARFKPIMKINPEVALQRTGKVSSLCDACTFSPEQTRRMVLLDEKLRTLGIASQDRPELGPCEFHSRHAFAIGPDGRLYKCPAFAGLSAMVIGDVDHEEFNQTGVQQLDLTKWDEKCLSCAFLPNCGGGCRMVSLNRTGALAEKSCDLGFLKTTTEIFMQNEMNTLEKEGR